MTQLKEMLPITEYELRLTFDYTGTIGEYENEPRHNAWQAVLADPSALISYLIERGCIDEGRLIDARADLAFIGDDGSRSISPTYATPEMERIGME